MSDVRLQELFDFDEEDLEANRVCRLSSRQEKRIKQSDWRKARLFLGAGIAVLLMVVFNTVDVLSKWTGSGTSLSRNHLSGLIIEIGVPGLLFGFLASISFKIAAGRTSHSVQQVCGRAGIIKREKLISEKKPNGSTLYRALPQYDLIIGKVDFEDMPPQILNVMQPGYTYIFYYLKDTKEVIAAEWIQ